MRKFAATTIWLTFTAGAFAAQKPPAGHVMAPGITISTGPATGIAIPRGVGGAGAVSSTGTSPSFGGAGVHSSTPIHGLESINDIPPGMGGAGINPQNTTAPRSPSNVDAPGPRTLSTDELPHAGDAPVQKR